MDTEQLKMILDVLRTASEAGQSAFVWWLVLDKVLPVVAWLITFAGLLWLAHRVIQQCIVTRLGEQVRDMLGIGSPGPMLRREADETLRRVRELMAKRGG